MTENVSRQPKPRGGYRGGSRKGVPNRATANAREAIARLVDDNAERLQEWLDEIRETKGAEAAWRCLMDVCEYHIPKLARTEVTGKDGAELVTRHVVELHEGPPPKREG